MLEAATESGHGSSESEVSITVSHTVGIDREKLVSLIQYMAKLSAKQRKQAAEIESLRLTLAELRRDCECVRTQLQRQPAPAPVHEVGK